MNYAYQRLLFSKKVNSFSSIDYLSNLRNKLDSIFNDFNKRKDNVLSQLEAAKWEPFMSFDLFRDNISIELLDVATQILVSTILIVTKTKGYDQYDNSSKQNIPYFNSLLVYAINIG